MDNFITDYLKNLLSTISEESINSFTSIITLKQFSKGDILLEYGKTSNNFYIIKKGLVASFIIKQDGSDFIRTIYKDYNEIASLTSLIKKEKSNANYKCLSDCEIYEACFDDFSKILKQNLEFSFLYIAVLQKIYIASEKRISELSSLNSTERYLELKKEIPKIDNLLPQYQIANYLNVTPVQLSRIRKKIFSK